MEDRFDLRLQPTGATVWAILSATVGTPSTRTPPPCDFGISTAFTGGGINAQAHPIPDPIQIVLQIGLDATIQAGMAIAGVQGFPVMASRMAVRTSAPFLRTVEMYPRTRSQLLALVTER